MSLLVAETLETAENRIYTSMFRSAALICHPITISYRAARRCRYLFAIQAHTRVDWFQDAPTWRGDLNFNRAPLLLKPDVIRLFSDLQASAEDREQERPPRCEVR